MAKKLTNSRAARAAAAAKAEADTNPETEAGAVPARSEAGPEGSSSNPAGPAATNQVAGKDTSSPERDRPEETAGAARSDAPALADPADAPAIVPGLRIASKRDGFRRAGMVHTKAPVVHPFEALESLTQTQWLALLKEPMLSTVEGVTTTGEVITREELLRARTRAGEEAAT